MEKNEENALLLAEATPDFAWISVGLDVLETSRGWGSATTFLPLMSTQLDRMPGRIARKVTPRKRGSKVLSEDECPRGCELEDFGRFGTTPTAISLLDGIWLMYVYGPWDLAT